MPLLKHTIAKLERRAKIASYTGLALAITIAVFILIAFTSGQFNIYQVVYLALPVIFLCCYLIGLLDADFTIYKDSVSKEIQGAGDDPTDEEEQP